MHIGKWTLFAHGCFFAACLSEPGGAPSVSLETSSIAKKESRDSDPACSAPLQTFGFVSPAEGEMKVLEVKVCRKFRYTACTSFEVGNPDLYGSISAAPTTESFDISSTDIGRPDCISFESSHRGEYHLGVYGAASGTTTHVWVAGSPLAEGTPSRFVGKLRWPTPTCSRLVSGRYSPFNSAWGNVSDLNRPFFNGSPNFIHGGTDIECPIGTPVFAPCDGSIIKSNDAGGVWGWYTAIECRQDDQAISIAFIHLNQASTLPAGTSVVAGETQVGTIFPLLEEPGEVPHLHITMGNRSYGELQAVDMTPQRGAAKHREWAAARMFWFNAFDPDLYCDFPDSTPRCGRR